MKNNNLNEITMKELISTVKELFPEMTEEEILNESPYVLQDMVENKIYIFDDTEEYTNKHCPSRKKRSKRLKKKYQQTTKYKKKGEWATQSRKRIKNTDVETNNRSFINKASKSYIPNRRKGYIN